MSFPFLTLPDPPTAGEGALDPLGLSPIGDRLAEAILPGLRVRMSRPRFLTAMAVCASVCEGLESNSGSDTPAYLVFEWLLVEAFVRGAKRETYLRTPGTLKAEDVRRSGDVMCLRTYLRVPTVFGINGVYKPLAANLGIARENDEQFYLEEAGYALLKTWQDEQGLVGFLESSVQSGPGSAFRAQLREAVKEGLANGYTKRSSGWYGWQLMANHLAPGSMKRREASVIHDLLRRDSPTSGARAELFRLLPPVAGEDSVAESELVTRLIAKASPDLRARLEAIAAFEGFASILEEAFDWIRHLSSHETARAISATDFAARPRVRKLAATVVRAIGRADKALETFDLGIQKLFADLARPFDRITTADQLFDAVLARHSSVQKGKAPAGKRDWFEREPSGGTYVRVPYQLKDSVEPRVEWARPYRLNSVRSFLADFGSAA